MPGKVEHMSVATIINELGESYYQIKIRADRVNLVRDNRGQELEILPGMVAEVDIVTGKKIVLNYMLKPVARAREVALRVVARIRCGALLLIGHGCLSTSSSRRPTQNSDNHEGGTAMNQTPIKNHALRVLCQFSSNAA